MAKNNTIDLKRLDEYIENKLITKRQHPALPIYILNYTNDCLHGWKWDDMTMLCRGLVIDEEGAIIARPFKKFFNYEEIKEDKRKELLKLPYTVNEKLDGSLIIYFKYKNHKICASRGSFESDQAKLATKLFQDKYDWFDPNEFTYLFELVGVDNRHVVKYEGNNLILLGAIRTSNGYDVELKHIKKDVSLKFMKPVVDVFDSFEEVLEQKKKKWDNEEGYVLTFRDPDTDLIVDRMKIKFDDYVRLHRIVNALNKHSIWKMIKEGVSFDELVKDVPYDLIELPQKWHKELMCEYINMEFKTDNIYSSIKHTGNNRKEFAEYVMKNYKEYQHILFKKLDIHNSICDIIEPEGGK